MFAPLSVQALNHLLAQNGWASKRLQRFSGKTARFEVAPFSFAYTILPDGLLTEADSDHADAVCCGSFALLPRLALRDEQATADIQRSGDAALLAEIFFLFKNLRWDAAEDLSRVTGDIAAERLLQLAHGKRQHLSHAAQSLAHASAEYLTEERPLIAKPSQLAAFVGQVDALRDDLARLEARVARMTKNSI